MRFEGGGDGDNATTGGGGTIEQPGEEVSLELVLTGLTGKDDDEGETATVDDGVLDGEGDLALIGTEVDAAGVRPLDGVTADGLADTEGEGERGMGGFWILDC